MSAIIVPTVTTKNLPEFNSVLEKLEEFATRIHFDFADGDFAPTKLTNVIEAHWPDYIHADFHLMLRDPLKEVETVISQHPNLVILHAESDNVEQMIDELNAVRIKTGVAILPETSVQSTAQLIERSEHVLIFGGHLGYYGGDADLSQLDKVAEIRAIRQEIEIGWDGGVNEKNVSQISDAGVDVINVGSYLQSSSEPEAAFQTLQSLLTK